MNSEQRLRALIFAGGALATACNGRTVDPRASNANAGPDAGVPATGRVLGPDGGASSGFDASVASGSDGGVASGGDGGGPGQPSSEPDAGCLFLATQDPVTSPLLCAPPPQVHGNVSPVWSLSFGTGLLGGIGTDSANDVLIAGSGVDAFVVDGQVVFNNADHQPFTLTLDPNGHVLTHVVLPFPSELLAGGFDAQSNAYLAGYMNPDQVIGGAALPGNSYLLKMSPDGTVLWAHGLTLPSLAIGNQFAVAVDAQGNVALTGPASGMVDFGSGTPHGFAGPDLYGFVVEFDTNGQYRFDTTLSGVTLASTVSFDSGGALAIAGQFTGTLGLGAPLSTPSYSAFAAKIDPAGSVVWQQSDGTFSAFSAVVAGPNVTYAAGNFAGTAGIGAPLAPYGPNDFFLSALDGSGQPVFEQTFRSTASVPAIAADPSGGVVVFGTEEATGDLGSGPLTSPPGFVLAKYDASGSPVFSARFAEQVYPAPYNFAARAVTFDGAGAILAAGQFDQRVNLGGGPVVPPAPADQGIFIAKYVEQPYTPSGGGDDCFAELSAEVAATCGMTFVGATLGAAPPIGLSQVAAVDGVYWADGPDVKMGIPSGANPSVIAFDQKNPVAFASDESQLYWLNAGTRSAGALAGAVTGGPGGDGELRALPLNGGALTTLATGLAGPTSIAVDDTNVYWTESGSITGGGATGAVKAVPIDGGAPQLIAPDLVAPTAVSAHGGSVIFAAQATAGGTMYQLGRTTPAGDPPTVLATTDRPVQALVFDDSTLYWWESNAAGVDAAAPDARLRSMPLAGGAITTILDGQNGAGNLAFVGSTLYVAVSGLWSPLYPSTAPGQIESLDVADGGNVLASVVGGQSQFDGMQVNRTTIVWSEPIGDPRSATNWGIFAHDAHP